MVCMRMFGLVFAGMIWGGGGWIFAMKAEEVYMMGQALRLVTSFVEP